MGKKLTFNESLRSVEPVLTIRNEWELRKQAVKHFEESYKMTAGCARVLIHAFSKIGGYPNYFLSKYDHNRLFPENVLDDDIPIAFYSDIKDKNITRRFITEYQRFEKRGTLVIFNSNCIGWFETLRAAFLDIFGDVGESRIF
jgi:hypothetical protein